MLRPLHKSLVPGPPGLDTALQALQGEPEEPTAMWKGLEGHSVQVTTCQVRKQDVPARTVDLESHSKSAAVSRFKTQDQTLRLQEATELRGSECCVRVILPPSLTSWVTLTTET